MCRILPFEPALLPGPLLAAVALPLHGLRAPDTAPAKKYAVLV
jgi:hypothetical protein